MNRCFNRNWDVLASRFKHVESIHFGTNGIPVGSKGIRVAITHTDGNERAEVMYPRTEDREALADIQTQIQSLLTKHGRLGLTAVAHAVWDKLGDGSEEIE